MRRGGWSRPSRARGLKHEIPQSGQGRDPVAPLAGAWIETSRLYRCIRVYAVAPLAGAWIETAAAGRDVLMVFGRAPRGRVD